MSQATKPLVVVPTYNEAENVDVLLAGIGRHAPAADVLFVDDDSRDGTPARIREQRARAPQRIHLIERPRRLGLGTAYIAGFRWALERSYDAVLQMDADLSHDPADMPRLLDFPEGRDAVVGSRYVAGGATVNWGPSRRWISRLGNVYARTILALPLMDATGGFNAWRRNVLERVGLDAIESQGYAFQIELKYRAVRQGFALHEKPITFVDRRAGQSKMSWAVAAEAVLRVLALRVRR